MNKYQLKPNTLETLPLASFSLVCKKLDGWEVQKLAAVNYATEQLVKYRNYSFVGIDVGLSHIGIALVGAGIKRRWWDLITLDSTSSVDASWNVVHAFNTQVLPRIKQFCTSLKNTMVIIECQPDKKYQRVSDIIKTWFYALGWMKDDVVLRSATAKMTIFEEESIDLLPEYIDKWVKIKSEHDKNKLVSVMRATTGLRKHGDYEGIKDLAKFKMVDKADDVCDAYLYCCKEVFKKTIEEPERRRKERLQKAKQKVVPFGRVTLK
uniref:RuvC-like Holliday junction resolvase n=1 Tax=Clandestinovirus TaxID=2831644 RepID=A0A8F8KUB5_9VIRU|nr:RuvC-like Holliday junction resolvase [Clandestinovirus]